ncbi:hypothetical protein Flavo103_12210 [Flavobacterium collinsii]|uniref:T9SS type A sorting domain-containing protein n=1 Tax=Flavobacterium collinsii TaxID=1114861 RepID=UPI0022BB1D5B|nr:T9SS type A sorting domain-containing protein [Flavobacterium collinsii]GIQ58085.1 hypothetical protein Flavo103_12210 [Flavobacterium collinsii]
MKYYITLLLLGISFLSQAQIKVQFNYDAAGNQILRELCLSGCSQSAKPSKDAAELTADDLLKFSPEDVISYYPNPVKEELYLKWQFKDDLYVSSIQVFSVAGQLLKSYEPGFRTESQNIAFQNYPAGVYAVMIYYSNGDRKSIKIIKN